MPNVVRFEDRFPDIIEKMPVELEDDETAIANVIAVESKAMAPRLNRAIIWPSFVRTPGWMAESIETESVIGGGTAVTVGAFWGLFVEFGTEHMRAQPFLEPPAHANEPVLLERVRETLRGL